MIMTTVSLRSALQRLPDTASEAVVNQHFSTPLLEALGFGPQEIYPNYPTGDGRFVDHAARKTVGGNIFLHTKSNPDLLVEVKGRNWNLSNGTAQYHSTVKQLKQYLLAPNCQTAQWGIITNSCHIQLFRKHGKVIHPATQCLALNDSNIDDTIAAIRDKIDSQVKALTIALYNNKGGVGKTTTTVNLAAILAFSGKRVLAIDFDHNQKDLTNALGITVSQDGVFQALSERNIALDSTLYTYTFPLKSSPGKLCFDVIPADEELGQASDQLLRNLLKYNILYRKLAAARKYYDYILIDSPPNWKLFSQLAVYAADVILMPTKHNNLFSLENTAIAIKQFFPEVQKIKEDGSPMPLPIFFNGEKITDAQQKLVDEAIDKILDKHGFDLRPYFYPKFTDAHKDRKIYKVPNYANIANAAFSSIPAVYRDRSAHEYYKDLAKEYFLQ